MSMVSYLKDKLLLLPLVDRVVQHLKDQGHTDTESEVGGIVFACLEVALVVLLFNTFLLGLLHAIFDDFARWFHENPFQVLLVALLVTMLVLAVWFRVMGKREEARRKDTLRDFREKERLRSKIESVRRGAMGDFKEAFEGVLRQKRPDLLVQSVFLSDASPRIRFHARKRNTQGGSLDKSYLAFRDDLFDDTRQVIATAFEVAPNAPIVTVDALLNFINRRAQFVDGPVLSVRARREVWQSLDPASMDPFQAVSALEVRYNDGSEVEPHPDLESRHQKVIERLRAEGPKLDLRYDRSASYADAEDWRPAVDPPSLFVTELSGREDVENLSLRDFECVVVKTLRRHGFDVPKAKTAPGNQLEFLAYHPHPLLGGSCLVWARQYAPGSRIPLEMVEKLDKRVRDESRQRGIFLATGTFTEEAAFRARKLSLAVADRPRFLEWTRWNADPAMKVDLYGAVTRVDLDSSVDLSALPVPAMQDLMTGLLGDLGFTVGRLNRMQNGAVKAVVTHNHSVLGGKAAVLARSFPERQRVDEEIVREFVNVMETEFCDRGFLFLSAYLTPKARALAASSGILPIERNEWYNLLEVFKRPGT
jgi:hypothetical protein